MAKVTVKINKKTYPCYPTLGAALRFKDETGRDVAELKSNELSDNAVYLWCCVVSACKREGVEFGMPLKEFADSVDMEQLTQWADAMASGVDASGASASGKKKPNGYGTVGLCVWCTSDKF